jgi:holo-[acyl-carrier-protein] synthase
MIQGMGIDMVELKRVRAFQDQDSYLKNILTDDEVEETKYYRSEYQPWIKFAVKEAVFKAFGCGLTLGSLWKEIDVRKTDLVELRGKMKELALQRSVRNIHYCYATSKHYIVAVVLLEQ